MKYSPKKLGLFQAVGLLLYISLFAVAVQLIQYWSKLRPAPGVSIIIFLLVFIISATICGTLALGYPAMLFFEGKKIEAVKSIVWTVVWLAIIAMVIGLLVLTLSGM
jgi:hypothetical protein